MTQIPSIVILALLAGGIGGWILCSWRNKAMSVSLEAQLSSFQEDNNTYEQEIDALQRLHAATVEALNAETRALAVAKDQASRIPELEAKLEQSYELLGHSRAQLAQLRSRLIEERNAAGNQLDLLHNTRELQGEAENTGESGLEEHYVESNGIFGDKADKAAVLLFSPERARRVADERWHPHQTGQFLTDGSYELRIPYRDERELVMDILRHGPHVQVILPESLRTSVCQQLESALNNYRQPSARSHCVPS